MNTDDTLGVLEVWKPDDEWDYSWSQGASAPYFAESMPALPASYNAGNHYMSPDISAVQRELRMMAAASPELALANLTSEMTGDSVDAMVYKELEMTKKRWMFSTLHQKEGYGSFNRGQPNLDLDTQDSANPPRILAVYETQGTSS
jgi:hypothetical protein